jgi:raffinose/stachyose/melibiose transport system substrate-binding protein
MKRRAYRWLGLTLVTLLLAGCGAAAAADQSRVVIVPEAPPPPLTLTVWDQFQRDSERAVIDELNAEFEANHPGVKINRVVMSFDDLRATVRAALEDPNGPDVVQVNQGADMQAVVQANLLLALTPYLPTYEWDQRFSASTLARNSFSAGGSQFGVGDLYGVSPTAEVVGVYYNKEKFQRLGLTVPKALPELEALLAEARQAGETPMALGNLDQMAGIHIFSAIEHVLLRDRSWLDDFVYGRGDVSFRTAENLMAAAIVQEWVQAGFFTAGFADIPYEESWRQFARGEGLMLLTGSWLSADIVRTGGERFGFFLLPSPEGQDQVLAIGGVGVPFSIRNGTGHPDLAAKYLDWMVSARAGQMWLAKGVLPAVPVHASRLPAGTLLGDVVAAYDVINAADGVGHYIDWAGPAMYPVLGAAVQDLMSLKVTPEEFVARVQEAYSSRP